MQLQDIQKVPYAVFELDEDGVIVKDDGDTAAVSSSDTDSATVVPDDTVDPAKVAAVSNVDASLCLQTGFIVGGKKVGNVTISTVYSHSDGTTPPPQVDSQFTVVAGPPATGNVLFGAAVHQ